MSISKKLGVPVLFTNRDGVTIVRVARRFNDEIGRAMHNPADRWFFNTYWLTRIAVEGVEPFEIVEGG